MIQRKKIQKIKEQRAILDEKQRKLSDWMRRDEQIDDEFKHLVPDSHAHFKILRHVFQKDDNEIECDNDSTNVGGEMEANNKHYDKNLLNECDYDLYQSVLKLRDMRIKHESELNKFRNDLKKLKKAHQKLVEEDDEIENKICDMRDKIIQVEKKKQQEINLIDTVIPLTTSQMYLDKESQKDDSNEGMEIDCVKEEPCSDHPLESFVTFPCEYFFKLRLRIRELKDDIAQQKADLKQMKNEKARLSKEKNLKESSISQQMKKCEELQLLKFGQLIDIDALDKISKKTEGVEEEERATTEKIKTNDSEVDQLNSSIKLLKQKQLEVTLRNTDLLNQIAELSDKHIYLEQKSRQQKCTNRSSLETDDLGKDSVEIKKLIRKQANEITKLKKEIYSYRKKEGKLQISIIFQCQMLWII